MGVCSQTKQHHQYLCSFTHIALHSHLLTTIHQLDLCVDLIGDTKTLGGYIQARIAELIKIDNQLQKTINDEERLKLLVEATDIIKFLYADRHFSQAYPILRESLHSIISMTQVSSESP